MKAFKTILKIVPHALLVVAGMFIVFLIIDSQNSMIEIIDNDVTSFVMAVWIVLSVVAGATLIYMQRREARRQAEADSNVSTHSESPTKSDIERIEHDLELLLEALRTRNGRGS